MFARNRGSVEFNRSYSFSQELPPFGSEVRPGTGPRAVKGQWSRRSRCLAFGLFLVLLAVVALGVAVAILAVQLAHAKHELKTEEPCLDPNSVQIAGSILDKLDTSVNPCEDFYQFSCGRWLKENPVPPTMTEYGQFEILHEKLAGQLKEILEEDVEEWKMPVPFLLAQDFYESCVNPGSQDEKHLDLLSTIDRLLGGSDNFILTNLTTILSNIRQEVGGNFIFGLQVVLDEKNSSKYAVSLDQPEFGISSMFLKDPKENQQRKNYLTLIHSAWKLVFSTDDARARVIANDILKLEIALANITTTNNGRVNNSSTYTKMTLTQLKNLTREETALDWDIYFHRLFQRAAALESSINNTFELFNQNEFQEQPNLNTSENTLNTSKIENFTANFSVIVVDPKYYQKLGSILNVDYNGRDILNYLKWRLIMHLGSESSDELSAVFFDYAKATTGILLPPPRWRYCMETTNFLLGPALSYRYVQKYFPHKYVAEAEMLVDDLRQAFHSILLDHDWLDPKTRDLALKKLDKMKTFVGYPKWLTSQNLVNDHYKSILNFKIGSSHFLNYIHLLQWQETESLANIFRQNDRTKWLIPPTMVNARYLYQDNSINFPAAILQPPFFGLPMQALNYGAIGSVIGHEIHHGFDDIGRQIDSEGNSGDWWEPGSLKSYMERLQCFVDQYANYTVNFSRSLWHVDGNLTLSENIADNGGLRQAFEAYKLYTERSGIERPLPGLEAYTPLQLFFVSFAQSLCITYTEKSLKQNLVTDLHCPAEFRVKGPLQNFAEFYSTWNCPQNATSNMLHGGREKGICRIW